MLELNMRERRRYLLEMATNLALLEFDIEQEDRNWKTVRLVDFAAIHAFAYGSGTDSERVDGLVELLESHRFGSSTSSTGAHFFRAIFSPWAIATICVGTRKPYSPYTFRLDVDSTTARQGQRPSCSSRQFSK